VIEAYLRELRGALPLLAPRRRILEEAESHLRDAAGERGEEEAIAAFGPAGEVAARYRPLAAWNRGFVLVAAALAFPVLQYPITENSLPPAPWPSADDMPAELAWKLEAILWLFPAAFGAALVAAVTWRRTPRLFGVALATVLALLGTAAVLGSVLAVDWQDRVPWAPPALQLLGPAHLVLVIAASVELIRAARLSHA
jgi:hypothetical protein